MKRGPALTGPVSVLAKLRKALNPKNLEDRFVKAVSSREAAILGLTAGAGALVAGVASGEVASKLGIPSSSSLDQAQTNAARLQAGIANVSGSMLVTGGAIGNAAMAAAGIGLQAGIAAASALPQTGGTLSGCGNVRDIAEKGYGVERVDIPDWLPFTEKYRQVGNLLTELVLRGAQDPEVVRAAKEVTVGAPTTADKIVAVGEWVRDHIKYVLDEQSPYAQFDGGTFLPEPGGSLEVFQEPAQTLVSKVGDCDCRSILVASMLRALGIQSGFRLITQDPSEPEVMTHIYSVVRAPGLGEVAVDTSPVMRPEGPEFHPVGWEPESASSIDILLPKIAPMVASRVRPQGSSGRFASVEA